MYKIVIVAVLYLTRGGLEVEIARYTVELRSRSQETCTAEIDSVGPLMERAVRKDLRESIDGAMRLRPNKTLDGGVIRTNSYCRPG